MSVVSKCGESNRWPQFPVTLKTRVVEITCVMPVNLRMSNNPSKRSVAPTYVLQKNQSREYHMIRNSIVQSLSNMKIKVTISQSCKTTRHAIKTFLTQILND